MTAPVASTPCAYVLGQIQANCANIYHGRLLQLVSMSPLWHIDAVGGRPPHQLQPAPPLVRGTFTRPAMDTLSPPIAATPCVKRCSETFFTNDDRQVLRRRCFRYSSRLCFVCVAFRGGAA